jgi:hypothetical protein
MLAFHRRRGGAMALSEGQLAKIESRATAVPKRRDGRYHKGVDFEGDRPFGYEVRVGSERSMRAVARFLDLGPEDVLVLVDEVRRLQAEEG